LTGQHPYVAAAELSGSSQKLFCHTDVTRFYRTHSVVEEMLAQAALKIEVKQI
jgi:hypothetical protein